MFFYEKAAGFQNDVECNQATAELQQFLLQCLQSNEVGNSQLHIGDDCLIPGCPSGALEFSRGLADRYPYLNNIFAWNVQSRADLLVRLNARPTNLISLFPVQQANAQYQSDSECRFYLIAL